MLWRRLPQVSPRPRTAEPLLIKQCLLSPGVLVLSWLAKPSALKCKASKPVLARLPSFVGSGKYRGNTTHSLRLEGARRRPPEATRKAPGYRMTTKEGHRRERVHITCFSQQGSVYSFSCLQRACQTCLQSMLECVANVFAKETCHSGAPCSTISRLSSSVSLLLSTDWTVDLCSHSRWQEPRTDSRRPPPPVSGSQGGLGNEDSANSGLGAAEPLSTPGTPKPEA